jgi:hypothetical protein
MSADRESDINVVNDAQGLIALVDDTPSDVVREENGELVIDFTAGGNAGGVNTDSYYRVGNVANYNFVGQAGGSSSDPYDDPAFYLVNNDTVEHDVTLTFTLDESPSEGSQLIIVAQDKEHKVDMNDPGAYIQVGDNQYADPNSDSTETGPYSGITLPSGGKAGVSIVVMSGEDSTGDDLSGTLTVSAD